MRYSLHTRFLLAAIVLATGMFVFFRINKRNFYLHYFRVIEEVEERNSQELTAVSPWTWFEAIPRSLFSQLVPALFVLFILFVRLAQIRISASEAPLLSVVSIFGVLAPLRAP